MRDKNGKVLAHGQQTLVKDKSGGMFFRHTFIIGVKSFKDLVYKVSEMMPCR